MDERRTNTKRTTKVTIKIQKQPSRDANGLNFYIIRAVRVNEVSIIIIILCIIIIVIVYYVVLFNKAVLLCIIIFMHLFI